MKFPFKRVFPTAAVCAAVRHFCHTIKIQTKKMMKIRGPYVVHFKRRDSPYVVHFIRRDSPYVVHFKSRDCPYV